MHYSFAISTPLGTSEANPKKTDMKLTTGIIHEVGIRNHAGNRGTLHLVINLGGHQLWPHNRGDDYHGDKLDINWTEYYELKTGYTVLTALTWNDSTLYAHECIIDIAMLPKIIALPLMIVGKISEGFRALIGAEEEA